ncbi:hypothetical protein CANARDRAFT_27433 [[Candida] arabinofermentans NRRL YB-2248]|uniref:General negative regulator of transcription subunit n=1 Tax=[Candida] arabinofermentans NRRL YB-2248 TaxID=983967 RepID=A0A1E4T375_9ASCO|nr:hypothetical protein CANARDRAFT_27433 [[Candida] arabinofermentans NRRL YB-2248]
MGGNEVKDKKQLIEHRKLIEHEMERFKEVEKIMKTKAFSNEALASSDIKVDPRTKEKLDCADFIQGNIEELERQIEALEAQVDQIAGTLKKKKSDASKQQQIDELNELSERHKWHTSKLETILRLLENDSLEVDLINEIRDDIEYYVDSNQDDHFIEDDTFYDALGLDEIDETFRVIQSESKDEETAPELDDKPVVKESKSAVVPGTGIISRKVSSSNTSALPNSGTPPPPHISSQPSGTTPPPPPPGLVISQLQSQTTSQVPPPTQQLQQQQQQHQIPPMTTAQTLASQLVQSQRASPKLRTVSLGSPAPTVASLIGGGLKPATPVSTPKLKYASVASAAVVAANATANANANSSGVAASTGSGVSTPTQSTPSVAVPLSVLTSNNTRSSTPTLPPGLISVASQSNIQKVQEDSTRENTASPASASAISQGPSTFSFLDSGNYSNLPEGFQDYITSLETAKGRIGCGTGESKSESQLPPLGSIFSQLESSLLNCPDSYDSDKPKNYKPTNQFVTQACFPQEPAVEIIGSTKLLAKLEMDTLAYCFYYHNQQYKSDFTNLNNLSSVDNSSDNYLQYITAKELNKRGWNYHKNLQTWFHKEDEEATSPVGGPKLTSGETWKQFDFKDTWMVRRKNDFLFDERDEEKLSV